MEVRFNIEYYTAIAASKKLAEIIRDLDGKELLNQMQWVGLTSLRDALTRAIENNK